ncbi:MAG: NAD-dependent epimerase/dehydratase family protein [Ferruginibacter sp.]
MKTVGILGGAGFIGSYVTKIFLDNGFQVRVSATDPSRKDKYQHLTTFDNAENLEIVQLNVENKEELKKFAEGCQVIVHGGTPFFLDVQDPQKQLFDPTVKGTENFLEVIKKTAGIEKVVFIASVAAYNTNFPMPPDGKTPADSFSEEDVKFTSSESHPYGQAKFMANQIVEKFILENENLPFEISSVSPVLVMGKPLSAREDSTSVGFQYLFKNKLAPDPFAQMLYDTDMPFAMVDVADVAKAVYNLATTTGLHGKNYLLSSETYGVSDIVLMLNGQAPLQQPTNVYKNDLATKDLAIHFRPVKETLNNYAEG